MDNLYPDSKGKRKNNNKAAYILIILISIIGLIIIIDAYLHDGTYRWLDSGIEDN